MTGAYHSGMNIVIEFSNSFLHTLISYRFAYALGVLERPSDFRKYCITANFSESMVLRSNTDDSPLIDFPILLQGELENGNPLEIEILLTFELRAEVGEEAEDQIISFSLELQNETPEEYGIAHLLREPDLLRWSISLDFLNILDVTIQPISAVTKVASGAVAVGIEINGAGGVDNSIFNRFDTNFLAADDQISIAIGQEVLNILINAAMQDLITRETERDERVLDPVDQKFRLESVYYAAWEPTYVSIITEGYWDDWHVRVSSRGRFFVDNPGTVHSHIKMVFTAQTPEDVQILNRWGYESFWNGVFQDCTKPECINTISFTSLDSWSPLGSLLIKLGTYETRGYALDSIEHGIPGIAISYQQAEIAEFLTPAEMEILTEELQFEVIRHIGPRAIGKVCGKPARLNFWDEGNTVESFEVLNTGGSPLHIRVSVTSDDLPVFSVNPRFATILPGESSTVEVTFNIPSGNPLTGMPAGDNSMTYEGSVQIKSNACETPEHEIQLVAKVTYQDNGVETFGIPPEEQQALCGWADIKMMHNLNRGLDLWRERFIGRPECLSCKELFVVKLWDPLDSYEFLAQTEEGIILAEDKINSENKELSFVVDKDDEIVFNVSPRHSSLDLRQKYSYLSVRSMIIEPRSNFQPQGELRASSLFKHGLCVATDEGLLLVDTLNTRKPITVAHLQDIRSLSDIVTFLDFVYAVSPSGLSVIDLSEPSKPFFHKGLINKLQGFQCAKCRGQRLWLAGEAELAVFDLSDPIKPNLESSYQLCTPTLDLTIQGNIAAVLSNDKIELIEISRGTLTKVGEILVQDAADSYLSTHNKLICLNNHQRGTLMFNIENRNSSEIVTHYRQIFWQSLMKIDLLRSLAYKFSPGSKEIEVCRLDINKVHRQ